MSLRFLKPLLVGFSLLVMLVTLRAPLDTKDPGCCQHVAHVVGGNVQQTPSATAPSGDTTPSAPAPAEPAHCLFCHVTAQALLTPLMVGVPFLVAALTFVLLTQAPGMVFLNPMTPPPRAA